ACLRVHRQARRPQPFHRDASPRHALTNLRDPAGPGSYGDARPGVHELVGTGTRRPPTMRYGPVSARRHGGVMNRDVTQSAVSRRTLVKGGGALGSGALLGRGRAGRASAANPGPAAALTPIQHIVICAEENRSFDHYYGFASWVGSYGVPAGYTQPNGSGGTVAPHHFTSLSTSDVPHSWSAMHSEYDGGRMDGFYTTGGGPTPRRYTTPQ